MTIQQTHQVHPALEINGSITEVEEKLSSPPTEGTNTLLLVMPAPFSAVISNLSIVPGTPYDKREVVLNRFFLS